MIKYFLFFLALNTVIAPSSPLKTQQTVNIKDPKVKVTPIIPPLLQIPTLKQTKSFLNKQFDTQFKEIIEKGIHEEIRFTRNDWMSKLFYVYKYESVKTSDFYKRMPDLIQSFFLTVHHRKQKLSNKFISFINPSMTPSTADYDPAADKNVQKFISASQTVFKNYLILNRGIRHLLRSLHHSLNTLLTYLLSPALLTPMIKTLLQSVRVGFRLPNVQEVLKVDLYKKEILNRVHWLFMTKFSGNNNSSSTDNSTSTNGLDRLLEVWAERLSLSFYIWLKSFFFSVLQINQNKSKARELEKALILIESELIDDSQNDEEDDGSSSSEEFEWNEEAYTSFMNQPDPSKLPLHLKLKNLVLQLQSQISQLITLLISLMKNFPLEKLAILILSFIYAHTSECKYMLLSLLKAPPFRYQILCFFERQMLKVYVNQLEMPIADMPKLFCNGNRKWLSRYQPEYGEEGRKKKVVEFYKSIKEEEWKRKNEAVNF